MCARAQTLRREFPWGDAMKAVAVAVVFEQLEDLTLFRRELQADEEDTHEPEDPDNDEDADARPTCFGDESAGFDEEVGEITDEVRDLIVRPTSTVPDNLDLRAKQVLEHLCKERMKPFCWDKCHFDVTQFVRSVTASLLQSNDYVDTPDTKTAGGLTQMGKTMFLVIGTILVANLGFCSVVITHSVQGRNQLSAKIQEALSQLATQRIRMPQVVNFSEGAAQRMSALKTCGCVVISDSCSQIGRAHDEMLQLQTEMAEECCRFVLFKDEGDAMIRTGPGYDPLQLELELAIFETSIDRSDRPCASDQATRTCMCLASMPLTSLSLS